MRKEKNMSVSFGKVISVNAPLQTAQKIAKIANGRDKTPASMQIKSIIDDTRRGKAHAFPVSKDKSYILSGKEGRRFAEYFAETQNRMEFVHNFFREEKIKDADLEFSWRRLTEQVAEIAEGAKTVPEMGVEYTKDGNIKSVNLIG